ncbi:MAG: AzlC family ABC transporter permease [Cocleimonas sp.]|nr:AzlC family ABC transporter permease [Cocleimonas sp.]
MFINGLKQSWPLVIGYFPVAIAFGISAQNTELSSSIIMLISILIFAGASQFTFITLVAASTPLLTTLLITIGLNLRHLIYSSHLSPLVKGMSRQQRAVIAFGLTDEVFATTISKLHDIPNKQRWQWIVGLELGAYLSWVIGTLIGIKGSDFLLDHITAIKPVLDFSLPALFFSLLLPLLNKKTSIVIMLAFIIALIFTLFNYATLGIFIAALLSPLIGLFFSRRNQSNSQIETK